MSSYFLEVIGNVHKIDAVYVAAECQNCEMTETGSDMDPMLEHFLLNSGQFSLLRPGQQRMLTRKQDRSLLRFELAGGDGTPDEGVK